jgi:hypothetical protein
VDSYGVNGDSSGDGDGDDDDDGDDDGDSDDDGDGTGETSDLVLDEDSIIFNTTTGGTNENPINPELFSVRLNSWRHVF